MSKIFIIFSAIVILGAGLRFYKLGQNPPSLNWDEVAHGYNAYSFSKTGRDEFGYLFPLSIRSFDDYKPPLYTYLTVISVSIFGLNDFAVRFMSALFGTLAIISTYLLVHELFKNKNIALISSLFLAISPWHIHFSRVAYEANMLIFLIPLGVWLFLKAIKKEKLGAGLYLSGSAFVFGLSLFTYHTARLFVPIFTTALLFIFRKEILRFKKYLMGPVAVTAIFLAVFLPVITSKSGQFRYMGTTVFSDVSPLFQAAAEIAADKQQGIELIGRILHNRRFVYAPIVVQNYLSHLNVNYLFFTADDNTHHAPGVGLLYIWDIPFILSGIYFLIRKKFLQSSKLVVILWFLLAPLASAFTWGVPNSIRSEVYLPTFQIFSAIGFYTLYTYTKRKRLFITVASVLLIINVAYYIHQYYIHLPIEYSEDWLYGRKQAALISNDLKSGYDRVIVSTKLQQPHEFWLYYLKYDPKKYLSEGGTVSGGFSEDRNHFDKFYFKPIDFQKQSREEKTLFVGPPSEFPSSANIIDKIDYLNGKPAIYIVSGS